MAFREHQFGQCLIIGHRGAAGLAPENTLPGFALAVHHGADAIELDVRYAHDTLWVLHDATLERTSNAQGALTDHSAAQLRLVDAGDGAHLPTLDEVLAAMPTHIGINIELKGEGCAAPLAAMLRGTERDLLVSSFAHTELHRFQRLCPEVPLAPLFSRWRPDVWSTAAELGAWSVNVAARLASRERIAMAHAKRLRLLAYTVNDAATAQRLVGYAVDGIFTDYPDGRLTEVSGRG